MAKIVLGLGVSHSPQLSTPTEVWQEHANRDRTNPDIPFEELVRNAPEWMESQLTEDVWTDKYHRCENSINEAARILTEAAPDIMVIIGDDHKELFLNDNMPTFSIFWGSQILDLPSPKELLPSDLQHAYWAMHNNEPEIYPTVPDLGLHIVKQMMEKEFDVSQFTEQPSGRSVSHAFTFIRRRLLKDRDSIPMVPVLINTYYPPNAPSAKRVYAFGKALREAIESWDSDKTVAVIASGGLSHFVIDEDLDWQILKGIKEKRSDSLTSIPDEKLRSGSSEIRNWIAAAGAMQDMNFKVIDYIPTYRSLAGTGCGMAFAYWTP